MNNAVSDSRLALWRSAIAIAYADGVLNEKELKLLKLYIPYKLLSAQQRQTIDNDLAAGVKLEAVFDGITEMRDRAHLINFARMLVQADGKICESEKEAIDYISKFHAKKLDGILGLAAGQAKAAILNQVYSNEIKREKSNSFTNDGLWLDFFSFDL